MLFDLVSLYNVYLNFYFSFEGFIFFVYDWEVVKKEVDFFENVIIYFYFFLVNDEFFWICFVYIYNEFMYN